LGIILFWRLPNQGRQFRKKVSCIKMNKTRKDVRGNFAYSMRMRDNIITVDGAIMGITEIQGNVYCNGHKRSRLECNIITITAAQAEEAEKHQDQCVVQSTHTEAKIEIYSLGIS
jgi:hypothetical protein